tara:strand:+ start:136 stop:315 length:180 start_codon:yes stop_codon:yes gene_type:complete
MKRSNILQPDLKDLCPMCNQGFKGCPCNRKRADDEKVVHANCLKKYNHMLKLNKIENGK